MSSIALSLFTPLLWAPRLTHRQQDQTNVSTKRRALSPSGSPLRAVDPWRWVDLKIQRHISQNSLTAININRQHVFVRYKTARQFRLVGFYCFVDLTHNPHDQFFKQAFSRPEVAADYLENYLPQEIAKTFDFKTLALVETNFIDQEFRSTSADLLFQIHTHGKKSNKPAFVYILFEHKSYNDSMVAFQLLRYMVRIWERHIKENPKAKTLPMIFPILFYHGESGWTAPVSFHNLFDQENIEFFRLYMPGYNYFLADLSRLPENQIRGDLLTRAVILLMKSIHNKDLHEKLPEIFDLIYQINDPKEKIVDLLHLVLYYTLSGTKEADRTKITGVLSKIDKTTEGIMTTIAESWVQEGIIKGREEGIATGIIKGRQEGIATGMEKGQQMNKLETAKKMIQEGLPIDLIQRVTGLSEKEIEDLK